MPESSSVCGELTAPPERMTSRLAFAVLRWPSWTYSTPTAFLPSKRMRAVSAFTSTFRFGRFSAGTR
jgi:hypothetical protein